MDALAEEGAGGALGWTHACGSGKRIARSVTSSVAR